MRFRIYFREIRRALSLGQHRIERSNYCCRRVEGQFANRRDVDDYERSHPGGLEFPNHVYFRPDS